MLRLALIVGTGSLSLFGASIHGLADSPPIPTMINPSPIVTQQSLPELVKSQVCAGSLQGVNTCEINDPCAGLAGSVLPRASAGVLQISRPDLANPTPSPPPTSSHIDFQVRAINCRPWDWCTTIPQLHFAAREYMAGFNVTQVTLRIGDREKRYEGSDAVLTLPQTGEQGAWLQYWAVSNHKEGQSPFFRLKYRYVRSSMAPECFRFDLLGSDWEREAPSGSLLWSLFPPLDQSLPKVLEQPLSAQDLYSANRYVYLSGRLIRSGLVNAADCPDGGLYANGAATPCGEQAGAEKLIEWQNKYNEQIYTAALKYNIPARILKGILAQESQFWPRSDSPYELGLGMFTEHGADLLLTWNVNYYLSNCIPAYGAIACSAGYSRLDPIAQTMMRRSVIDKIGTDSEIDVLAAALLASAAQVDQMVFNTSRKEPADLTNYETMWKITTANYYAGSGCTGAALDRVSTGGLELTWEQLVLQMDESCQVASRYVEKIFSAAFESELLGTER